MSKKKIIIFSNGSTNLQLKKRFSVEKTKRIILTVDKTSLFNVIKSNEPGSVYSAFSKRYKKKYS